MTWIDDQLRDARQELARELNEWRDAGAPIERVMTAIERLIEVKMDKRVSEDTT